jgi:FkbM family methyltransferase
MKKSLSLKTKILNVFRLVFKIHFMEKMLVKRTNGKSFNSTAIKFIPNNYQYKKNTWRTVCRDGINYRLDIYDYIDWWLYFGIKDEGRDELYALTKTGAIIFDIGTNVGETLMNFAKLVGPNGFVHGFEPDTVNHARCMQNIKLNDFKNIVINKKGLGNVPGKFSLMVDTPSNRGGNRISEKAGEKDVETIDVITLDDYVSDFSLDRLDLIKIDVEGFEFNVLKGAEKTITKFKPALFIELDDNNLKDQQSSAKDLVEFLIGMGYEIFNAQVKNSINGHTDFTNCHFDIICKAR